MSSPAQVNNTESRNAPLFLDKPETLYVDQDHTVKSPANGTIWELMQSLKKNGPLVAIAKIGPGAYNEAPFKLQDQVKNLDVYGWKPNTAKDSAPYVPVILLGAQTTESNAYVYFTQAQDITPNEKSLIRGYTPLSTDEKIYIISYAKFLERLNNLYPICPHVERLFSVAASSIVDMDDTEEECKEIGQKIFDQYKNARNDSQAGILAMHRICYAAHFLGTCGILRRLHIAFVWDGVGDNTYRWRN